MRKCSDSCGKLLRCWGDCMVGEELPQEKKEQLINRVTKLANEGILEAEDWFAIYDILLNACHREEIRSMEQYLMGCLAEGE